MKKVLILSYYFPPYEYTGGQRAYSWYTELKKNKIYPVVVTRHWNNSIIEVLDAIKPSSQKEVEITNDADGTIIRVPFKPDRRDLYHIEKKNVILRKTMNFFNKTRFFSLKNDKTANLFFEADRYLKDNKCDLIIATCPPFILFRYAYLLSSKNNIPWIADYRDGWSTNSTLLSSGIFKRTIYRQVLSFFEKKYVNSSVAITTAADPYESLLKNIFPKKTIHVIYNGYNPSLIREIKTENSTSFFTIAYAGTLYPFQDIELFLKAYALFVQEIKDDTVRLIFYGVINDKKQLDRITTFDTNLNQSIVTTERMSKKSVLNKLSEASVCLLLSSTKVETLASKIFDYMALKKKIILVPNDASIMSKMVSECNAGISCSDPIEIKKELMVCYNEFKKQGFVSSQTTNFEKYQWTDQVHKLSEIIHSLKK